MRESKLNEGIVLSMYIITIIIHTIAAISGFTIRNLENSGLMKYDEGILDFIKRMFRLQKFNRLKKYLISVYNSHKEDLKGLSNKSAGMALARIIKKEDPDYYAKIKDIGNEFYQDYILLIDKMGQNSSGRKSNSEALSAAKLKYGFDGYSKMFESSKLFDKILKESKLIWK